VYSRRGGGPTSFGYRTRVAITAVIAAVYLSWFVMVPPWSGPFGLVYAVSGLVMAGLILRSVWKRVRIR
jgi:hypothetical protein